LRAIIGRYQDLKKLGPGLVPSLPEPNLAEYWSIAREGKSQRPHCREQFRNRQTRGRSCQAGHYPTVDLVGSYTAQGANAAVSSIGNVRAPAFHRLQLNVPSIREDSPGRAYAKPSRCRKNRGRTSKPPDAWRCSPRRPGRQGHQRHGVGEAFEQAVVSASALASSIISPEVGVRTFLGVLQVQQNVYSTRRDVVTASNT
jgi:outer membrane protein